MPLKTLIEAVNEALHEEMERDPSVIVLGEDVGVHGGVFRATDGLQKRFGADRVIDTPLAELSIVGVAIGAAMQGLHPVAEIQFADYVHPAYDQIVNEAAKIRYRSNGTYTCPLVIRAPFGAGVHGGMYHSQSVEALFFHVPGLKIVIPSSPADCKGLLKSAVRDPDPVLFFEHKKSYRRIRGEVPDGDVTIPLGQAAVKREGSDVTVVTYGVGVHLALEAAERVERDGISVEVLDLRTLAPLDREAIARSVGKTNKVLIVHEDNKTGGIGAEIAAQLAEEHFEQLDGPILRVAAADTHIPYAPSLEEAVIPNVDDVEVALRRLAAY
ncbi:MAG TPA: alpha-ketoacid dehydrogenase subunit beta [Chloroflexota bacterium]|nr:alpha-ketoacid dehydrogenase subunit beta [Chloroflexota bacterium]